MKSDPVFAFKVWVQQRPEWERVINARSRGKAKVEYYRSLTESWPDFPYIDIRCRKIGDPHTSSAFTRNAQYRGMPGVKCGQRVAVGEGRGVIVGHNYSANFNVLFDDDSPLYPGQTLNVHPSGCVLVEES